MELDLSAHPPVKGWCPRMPPWIQEVAWTYIWTRRTEEGCLTMEAVLGLLAIPNALGKALCLFSCLGLMVVMLSFLIIGDTLVGKILFSVLVALATVGATIVMLLQTERVDNMNACNELWRAYYRGTERSWWGLESPYRHSYALSRWALGRVRIWEASQRRDQLMDLVGRTHQKETQDRKM